MFGAIVGALLFVFVGIPIIIWVLFVVIGALTMPRNEFTNNKDEAVVEDEDKWKDVDLDDFT